MSYTASVSVTNYHDDTQLYCGVFPFRIACGWCFGSLSDDLNYSDYEQWGRYEA